MRITPFVSFCCLVLLSSCSANKTANADKDDDKTATDKMPLTPDENVMFWSSCTPNGTIASKLWGCYISGPVAKTSQHSCPDVKDFCQLPQTKIIINDCKQKGTVFAVWVEIEMGSNPGIMQESIEKWLAVTKDTINYMKTSGEFPNDTLEASIAKMNSYGDDLTRELTDYNTNGAKKVTVAINAVKDRITGIFKATTDAETARLLDLKSNIDKINPIIDEYEKGANQQTATYLMVVTGYDTFKKTGVSVASDFRQKSLAASGTEDYDQLAKIKMGTVDIGKSENIKIADLFEKITFLRENMSNIQFTYDQALNPYKVWMIDHKFKIPDLLTVAITSLDNMAAYLNSRKAFTNDATKKLVSGIETRTKAIILSKADKSTRDTISNEAQSQRAIDFMNTINAKIADMWKISPKSKKLGLNYLYPKYEKFAAVLAYETICQVVLKPSVPTSWMATGCNLMLIEFSKAKNYLKDGLPIEIQVGVSLMQAAGVDTTFLIRITQLAAQNKPAEAARLHDVALMSTEVRSDQERL
jgi:hypothetical protein